MNKQERILCAIQGQQPDIIPYSVWYHFGTQFLPGEQAADVVTAFYDRYDLDFLKVMNDYAYPLPAGLDRIRTIADWNRLTPIKPTEGGFAEQLKLLKVVARRLKNEAFFVDTVFDPFYVARRTAKDVIFTLLRSHPEEFKRGLEVIAESLRSYVRAVLEIGAAGIFLAVNGATTDFFTREEFREFVKPYSLHVLEAAQAKGVLNILHVHGDRILFDEILNFPVQVLSWEHRHTPPTFTEARQLTERCFLGGLDEKHPNHMPPDELETQVEQAIQETHGRKLILGPGCSFPTDMPVEQIDLIYKALRKKR